MHPARAVSILAATVLMFSSLTAQETQVPTLEVPAEEIAQGRNKGVETWEGTLFGQDSYKPGSYAQIEVVPNPGFEFENWEGENIANPQAAKTFVTMKEHAKVKPHYNRIWNVIAAPDNKEAGKVEGGGNYPNGSEVALKVIPNEGFKFLGWEGKGIKEEEKEALETTITVDGDHDIIAKFENENKDQNSGGGGGGGDSDQNQDQSDQNQDQNQEQNQDQQDQGDQNEDQQDQGDQPEQPQDPDSGEDDPAEPEEGDEDQQNQDEQGGEEEQPQEPGGEQEAPAQETQAEDGQPVPMQMTPEEATRLLEAMQDGEKKLPLFIVTPPDQKKDTKKDW